jgi:capsular polysaccharide biosynthesis protein
LADQIRTFKDAEVVLGAFGAGLTNMLFSRPRSMILELQDPIFAPRPWYWKMASILGHEWRCCVGQSNFTKISNWATDWPTATFSLEEKELAAFLESALRTDLPTSKRQWWNCNPVPGVIS